MTVQLAPEKRDQPSTEPLRLNLGGRDIIIPGFKTVDLSEEHNVDYRTDVSDLSMFKDGEVDEIYASQILEHFPHVRTVSVLKEWYRVLRKGGKITIGVPDFQRAVDLFLKFGLTNWVTNQLYGDQIYPLAFHYAPFTFGRLALLMNQAGFSNPRRILKMPYGIIDCSALVSNKDQLPVSLNVEAIKP